MAQVCLNWSVVDLGPFMQTELCLRGTYFQENTHSGEPEPRPHKGTPKIGVFSRNGWKMLGIEQLECVSYSVVYGVSYYVDSEKALINDDDRQERELRVKLCRLIVETHLG